MMHLIYFIIGAVLGSFFHVVFLRKDWYKGRSRCDSCGYTLKWYDLIPILNYIILRGKCRKCNAKIPPTHFLSELITGCSSVAASLFCKDLTFLEGFIVVSGLIFLSLAAIEDMIEQQIYSLMLYAGIITVGVAKITHYVLTVGVAAAMEYLITVLLLRVVFWVISKIARNMIGEGDFELGLLIAIICGGIGCFYSVFYASLIGCIIYIPLIIFKKHSKEKIIPFAPLLLAGTICYLTMGGINLF